MPQPWNKPDMATIALRLNEKPPFLRFSIDFESQTRHSSANMVPQSLCDRRLFDENQGPFVFLGRTLIRCKYAKIWQRKTFSGHRYESVNTVMYAVAIASIHP